MLYSLSMLNMKLLLNVFSVIQEIDSYIAKASDQGYSALVSLGSRGFNYATNIVLSTAMKVNGIICTCMYITNVQVMYSLPV